MADLNESEKKLLNLFNNVNEQGQEKIIDYADCIASLSKYMKKFTSIQWWKEHHKQQRV